MNNILKQKIYGIPAIATAVGGFALLSTMFMWYGSFFVDQFHPLMGIVEEQVTTAALGIWYPVGILLTFLQGLGIALLLKWRGWPGLLVSAYTGATAAVLLGATVFGYRLVILPEHSIELFLINSSGLITAWTLAAVLTRLLHRDKGSDDLTSATDS